MRNRLAERAALAHVRAGQWWSRRNATENPVFRRLYRDRAVSADRLATKLDDRVAELDAAEMSELVKAS